MVLFFDHESRTSIALIASTSLLALGLVLWLATRPPRPPVFASPPSVAGPVRLIIDGSNGPLRLDPAKLLAPEISFLHVKNGVNCSDRLDLIPILREYLAARAAVLDGVDVYFDGRGVFPQKENLPSDYDPCKGKDLPLNPHVQLKITPWWTEADGLIVQQVADRCTEPLSTTSELASLEDVRQKALEFPKEELSWTVYTLWRKATGPGKARRILKRYDLLRPGSVFCLFGLSDPAHNQHVLSQLQQSKVSWRRIYQSKLSKDAAATIVATDDILLRQRIVEAGGYVVTFEQLWQWLVPYATVISNK